MIQFLLFVFDDVYSFFCFYRMMNDTISCFCLGWSGASPPGRKAGSGAQVPDPGEPQH